MTRENGGKPPHAEAAKIATLTACERQVITLVGEGLRNKQIAQRLFISETTVRHHLTLIFRKLGVAERLELIMYAYRHGLAKIPAWGVIVGSPSKIALQVGGAAALSTCCTVTCSPRFSSRLTK